MLNTLGRDLKGLSKETCGHLKDLLDSDELTDGLALAISRDQYNYQEASRMLQMIKQGFLD